MLVHPFKLSTARMDLIHEVLIELKVITSTTETLSIPEVAETKNHSLSFFSFLLLVV